MEKPRKLVTVRRIASVEKIPQTRFVAVQVDGWKVVVDSRDGFKKGQLVVYFETDSFLPDSTYFWEYCAKDSTEFGGQRGYRVRTAMKGKHISSGLVFPLEKFAEIESVFGQLKSEYPKKQAGEKLMEMSFDEALGVKKWELPQDVPAHVLGPSPVFIQQPGCSRAQNMLKLFEEYGKVRFQITEKLDGYPMTIYCVRKDTQWCDTLPPLPQHIKHDGPVRIGICSRRYDLMEHDYSLNWITAKAQGMLDKVKQLSSDIKNVAVQGELCGSSIYTNSMGFAPGEHHFYVFDIFDIDKQKYLNPHRVVEICEKLEMDHTPVVEQNMALSTFATDVDDLVAKAEGLGVRDKPREGLVFREVGGNMVFKVISNSWLLQTGKE